jgi:uncharacterized membrane protein YfhO
VVAQADRLTAGRAAATVAMHRRGVVVLSASFDPGWTVTVDGRSQPTEMVAPALVATTVQAGTHRVVFHYAGFRGYSLLFVISAATLLTLLCAEVARPLHHVACERSQRDTMICPNREHRPRGPPA